MLTVKVVPSRASSSGVFSTTGAAEVSVSMARGIYVSLSNCFGKYQELTYALLLKRYKSKASFQNPFHQTYERIGSLVNVSSTGTFLRWLFSACVNDNPLSSPRSSNRSSPLYSGLMEKKTPIHKKH